MIDGFSEFEPIGRGGFSVVYRAREAYVDRLVAIKVLHGVSTDDAMARDRFLREVRAMGRLSGIPNVVDVYRPVFTEHGEPCIVMPYLAGGNLTELLDSQGPLWASDVRDLGITLATALATAHSRGIHHRDIKPENVLLDTDHTPYLGDFGIAVMADLRAGSATAATLSPPHAPPERIAPTPHTTNNDAAGDVYSLGSTLYTLLAGQPPFGNPHDIGTHEFNLAVLNTPPPPLPRTDVPTELDTLIQQCLAKDPTQRPTATQLAHTLTTLHITPTPPQPTNPDTTTNPPTTQPDDTALRHDPPATGGTRSNGNSGGGTEVRKPLEPQPIYVEKAPAKSSSPNRWLILGAAGVGAFVLAAVGAGVFGGGTDGGSSTSTTNSTETTASAPVTELQPPVIEEILPLPSGDGFTVRWSDPNDPAGEIRLFRVGVDGATSDGFTGDASEGEFVVTEVPTDVVGSGDPIDLRTSEYCVEILLGALLADEESSIESLVASNVECVGPTP